MHVWILISNNVNFPPDHHMAHSEGAVHVIDLDLTKCTVISAKLHLGFGELLKSDEQERRKMWTFANGIAAPLCGKEMKWQKPSLPDCTQSRSLLLWQRCGHPPHQEPLLFSAQPAKEFLCTSLRKVLMKHKTFRLKNPVNYWYVDRFPKKTTPELKDIEVQNDQRNCTFPEGFSATVC